jgi:hypothetical protein
MQVVVACLKDIILCGASLMGFECSQDPESYAGGSIATGRGTHAGHCKG